MFLETDLDPTAMKKRLKYTRLYSHISHYSMNNTHKQLKNLAPNWARWLAQDADGAWWAYEHEPNQSHNGWYENEVGRYQRILQEEPNTDWHNALIKIRL